MVSAFVIATATSAGAQTKFSGKCSQPKPDPNYTVPVGDRANHAMMLAKTKCTWTSAELAGIQLKDEDDTMVSDMSGNTSRDRGYGVGMLANGDKYFVRFDGTTTYQKNEPVSATCTWSFTGGTGKLKGLTGKGTCSGTFDASGAAVFDIQGEYQVAAPKTK
jgi:hypothetical protein